uniref:Secreted protein n=1 Tax=Mycena chlorophos TaxID=658473 RepID=A0ABQ0L163_MYCCL|nr:predicted protein [Mycena chlorophos]
MLSIFDHALSRAVSVARYAAAVVLVVILGLESHHRRASISRPPTHQAAAAGIRCFGVVPGRLWSDALGLWTSVDRSKTHAAGTTLAGSANCAGPDLPRTVRPMKTASFDVAPRPAARWLGVGRR